MSGSTFSLVESFANSFTKNSTIEETITHSKLIIQIRLSNSANSFKSKKRIIIG